MSIKLTESIEREEKPGPKFADVDRLFRALQRLNLGPVRLPEHGGGAAILFGPSGEFYQPVTDKLFVTDSSRGSMLEKEYENEPETEPEFEPPPHATYPPRKDRLGWLPRRP